MTEIDREYLNDLYWNQKLSMRKIAHKLGLTRHQVESLFEQFGIAARSNSEAQKILSDERNEEKKELAMEQVRKIISKNNPPKIDFTPIIRKNLLIPVPLTGDRNCAVTIVLSDLHIGDANHLSQTYWSTVSNIVEVVKNISSLYNIAEVNLVLNGDIVAGRDVYRFQELRNLIQRGHWQVFLAEIVMKDTLDRISDIVDVNSTYFIKGTHENLASNFILFLKRIMNGKTKYLSNGGVVNIAGCLGSFNVLFTHGYGYSDTSPVSSSLIKDVLNSIIEHRNRGVQIDRVCSSHSHWLSSGLLIDDIYWDVTGGFQKWEYTLGQRPSGAIVYLFNNNECVSIPVRPDPIVESNERSNPGLEYQNLVYYGNFLLKHLKEIEDVTG